MRVQLAHHVADDAGALHVPAVGPQAHVGHLVQDPPLHRLQAVPGVGKRAGVDDRVGVLEERPLHLARDVDVLDALVDRLGRRGAGHRASCGVGIRRSAARRRDRSGRCARLARMSLMLPAIPPVFPEHHRGGARLLGALTGSRGGAAAGALGGPRRDRRAGREPAARPRRPRPTPGRGVTKKDVLSTVFPTTTAAALTICSREPIPGGTASSATVRDPQSGVLVNQLPGWERRGWMPAAWQTRAHRLRACGRAGPAGVRGRPARHTRHRLHRRDAARGRTSDPRRSAADRVAVALSLAEEHEGALVYCYLPELDKAAHKHGVASAEWVAALEDVDAAMPRGPPAGRGHAGHGGSRHGRRPAARHLIIDGAQPAAAGRRGDRGGAAPAARVPRGCRDARTTPRRSGAADRGRGRRAHPGTRRCEAGCSART